MALIAMAVFDTPENQRSDLTRRTLESLSETVDFTKHRIFVIVNAATEETTDAIAAFGKRVGNALEVIYCQENIGTARAINKAWKLRQPGEHAIKMDNDVVIYKSGWVDEMEEAISRDMSIGIIGLKRKDLWETPWHPTPEHRSTLRMLPHESGQKWIIVEDVNHVMGTCQMYSASLLDQIGYLYQPTLYGHDDSLAALRCRVAGFKSCFLHGYEIDHIDPPNVMDIPYTTWKMDVARTNKEAYEALKHGYLSGALPIWYGPDGEQDVQHHSPYQWVVPNYNTR